jgi:succinyl-diaminopimelate desuccinylase
VDLDLGLPGGELTAALVDVESVSGNEGPLADAIEAALGGLPHLTVHRAGNVIVARTSLGRARRVVLAGHIDTVPVAGNLPSRLHDGKLYGCGTTDMKSGVAVQLRLAATLGSPLGSPLAEPVHDVTYVFYDCEEVEAARNGLGIISRTQPDLLAGDFAILLEPTGGGIEGGCQGTLRATVTVEGKRAHTARSWMGVNAIHAAGSVLDVLRSYQARSPIVDGLQYREGLNAVFIEGGVAGNVVPDQCVITVNYRFAPDRRGDEAAAHVRSVFASWPVEIVDCADGARPGLTDPAAAAFVSIVGGTPKAKLGWTDVSRFAALGIPAVNYGPGIPDIAHTPGEYVEVAAIAGCEERLRTWLTS